MCPLTSLAGARCVRGSLWPRLGPDDRNRLPRSRELLADYPVALAEVHSRMGHMDDTVALAVPVLKVARHRWWAADWLSKQGRRAASAEGELRRAVAESSGRERVHLALALWHVGGPGDGPRDRAMAALEKVFRDAVHEAFQDAVVAVHAALADARDPVPVLTRMLADLDPHYRAVAAAVLALVDPTHPRAVAELLDYLTTHPSKVRSFEGTLSALGPRAKSFGALLPAKAWGAAEVPGAVPADLEPLWDDLASDDALTADLAAWRLAGAGARAVALVNDRLRPPPVLMAEQIARWIADLDNDSFEKREAASAELAKSLESTVPALRAARAGKPSPEVRSRLDRLTETAERSESPEQMRRLRAVDLLRELDCPEAAALLARLSRDARFRPVLDSAGR